MLKYLLITLLSVLFSCSRPNSDTQNLADIEAILLTQEAAWNTADLEGFMNGYLHSDSLLFIGKSGVTKEWDSTLKNYIKGYPDQKAMGKLKFTILKKEILADNVAMVIGKWHLTREAGNLEGHFSLIWKKVDGQWVIIADHSS
ncbi:YybH family protein [Flammeovirga kamogawensis]|uniref:Nuclear transport factor 2 family protein n=1 Tax=Flammeovirga kamogawensis TaxID=373891 RepID=A0ABX8H0I7_9BACT|nr:nuclear transport factor 2 family protein [Flammeovirga kamogawensis]MBB6459569.1 ketosteroid isomerase-like protein [Flammeovirga kamogawensis]QWG09119.1 nuclear transport factor 2 family protein [Flammeovirga kamogawensis]TRX67407.1 nuclear transport factor 2 family protein [Flammeovirga kamogawensis]